MTIVLCAYSDICNLGPFTKMLNAIHISKRWQLFCVPTVIYVTLGPFTKMLIGTTVLCDVVVVVSFAILLPITASLCSKRPFEWSSIAMLVCVILYCRGFLQFIYVLQSYCCFFFYMYLYSSDSSSPLYVVRYWVYSFVILCWPYYGFPHGKKEELVGSGYLLK